MTKDGGWRSGSRYIWGGSLKKELLFAEVELTRSKVIECRGRCQGQGTCIGDPGVLSCGGRGPSVVEVQRTTIIR
jgi:hypothetical protein